MSDFVTLSCPSCGGKLTVQKNTPTYICDYCGTEHKLREEDIEYFGRCPRCHRNDRVEKITAIVNRHDQLGAKFPSPEQLNLDEFVERPDLLIQQKLNSLPNPQKPDNVFTTRSKFFFIVSAFMFIQFLCAGSFYIRVTALIPEFLWLICSLVLAALGIYFSKKSKRLHREIELEILRKRSVLEQELVVKANEVRREMTGLRRQLKIRYEKIYYCHRDDLLFIPGDPDYASCNNFVSYLTQILQTRNKA